MAGTLYVVATPIGNLEDITVRALRILKEVALIAAEDTRRTAHLLTRYGITTPTTSLHEHNEHAKSSSLIARLKAGDNIAVVSDAGTPTVSDPGRHLIAEAIAAGVRVEAIPGPSAVVTALSVSGLADDEYLFLGFPPTRSKDRKEWMERLRKSATTVVFYEAPHRIVRTLEEIRDSAGDVHVLVGRELTKAHEELVRGPISEVLGRGLKIKGEFTVVAKIGHTTEHGVSNTSESPPANVIGHEFGLMTASGATSRRQAINALARKYGLSAREAYQAVEASKKSGG
jgi:16S rRNA (cytidine1402-2'-O)-methyltransferase